MPYMVWKWVYRMLQYEWFRVLYPSTVSKLTHHNYIVAKQRTIDYYMKLGSTKIRTVLESSLNDSQVDAHGSSDAMTIRIVPELSLDDSQVDADASSNVTVTGEL